jgi:beta-glucosidase
MPRRHRALPGRVPPVAADTLLTTWQAQQWWCVLRSEEPEYPDLGTFPNSFVWGAATSAYQIEGAVSADGRGRSIWDTFVDTPGRVLDASTGETATESYHRVDEDVALLSRLGLGAYRFSVAWPRVLPQGRGNPNQAGLDYYQRLVDALLAAGIDPWITLYHWDLPQPLETAGGWPLRDTAHRFAEFAAVVHDALGDRVRHWITVNEPWCAAFLGYASGEHAPGRREPAASLAAAHHLLLGHGLASEAIRAQRADARIGIGLNFYPVHPASDSPADHDAVRRVDGMQNRFFADAVLKSEYPADVLDDMSAVSDLSFIADGDLAVIGTRLDMLCVNYYSRFTVSADPRHDEDPATTGPAEPATVPDAGSPWPGNEHIRFVASGLPQTAMGWDIDPDGLRDLLLRLARDYPDVPLVITENGSAFDDTPDGDEVHDPQRLAYLAAHLNACEAALRGGAPLRGYFAWSLLDNFEWAWGYTKRFGIVSVDYDTQRRVIKDSGKWYSRMVGSAGCHRPTE